MECAAKQAAQVRAVSTRILGKTMRDVVRNQNRWKMRVRLPKILVLTFDDRHGDGASSSRRLRIGKGEGDLPQKPVLARELPPRPHIQVVTL